MTSLWHHQFISIIAVILYGIVAILCNINDIKSCTSLLQRELPLATSIRLPGHLLENNQLSQEDATSCCPQSSTLHNLPITTKLLNVAYNFWLLYYSHRTTLTSSTDNISILHATHNYNRGNRCACGCMCVNVCALCECVCFVRMCVLCVHVCACMCMCVHVYALCELHMELCQLYAHFHVLNMHPTTVYNSHRNCMNNIPNN